MTEIIPEEKKKPFPVYFFTHDRNPFNYLGGKGRKHFNLPGYSFIHSLSHSLIHLL